MKITRRKIITVIEEKKTSFVSNIETAQIVSCPYCAAEMIRAQDSADSFGFSIRVIYRLIEENKIHFTETAANEIYVCPVSIENKVLHGLYRCP